MNIRFQMMLNELADHYPHLSAIIRDCPDPMKWVKGIENDSRKVSEGSIFVAIRGYKSDGKQFIGPAIENGAIAVFVNAEDSESVKAIHGDSVPIIAFDNTRIAQALSARIFYDNPSEKLKLIGITGTNGKTTITYMLKSIIESAGEKVALIGTICNYIGGKKIKSPVTTPDSLELNRLFQEAIDQGVNYVVMEVSSHALYLDRVAGLNFDAVIFTNLSADHLDFHKDMSEYLRVKQQILDVLSKSDKKPRLAVLNGDLDISSTFVSKAEALNLDYVTYGLQGDNTYQASDIDFSLSHSRFNITGKLASSTIEIAMPGEFNIYNTLASYAVAEFLGFDSREISSGLKNATVPGRFQTIQTAIGAHIIIDYAHTDDAIKNVLSTLWKLNPNRVISVFGCGGDRDKSKRPLMGAVSGKMSSLTIVTSDNPRSEDPDRILDDIIAGVNKARGGFLKIENRYEAIKQAIEISEPGDVILIAGKGHEDYQILKNETIHFDDKEVVEDVLRSIYG